MFCIGAFLLQLSQTQARAKPALTQDSTQIETTEDETFVIVEEMPKFQGGDFDDFRRYLMHNVTYPEEAMEEGLCLNFVVQFIVDKKGEVRDIEVIRSCNPVIEAEVVRVIESSPPWTPGKQKGKPVNVMFTLPVHISLQ